MSALYRRVRPLTFAEVVGQEHVKEPLMRAIREGRLAQAYLFSGPRGVGKTTTARLLAMAVGCQGKGERPCGVCAHCQSVQRGAHPDVVEIDAASNNSVEDVRELRERILLAPLSAPRKVFILDEAHMLSKSAFNALLKTLEEPPPHVLFVFATTEPERMPPTILSRTQHYRFRRLKEEEIASKLQRILKEMGREAEAEALLLVARLADGAMRDAESLLDRLLLLEGPLTRKRVEEALGLPPKEALSRLARGLARGDLKEVLSEARGLYAKGFAPRSLVGGLMEVLREALYAAHGLPGRALPAPPEVLLAALAALDESLERLSRRSDLLALEVALLGCLPAGARGAALAQPPSPEPAPLPEFDPLAPLPSRPPAGQPGREAEGPKAPAQADLSGSWRAFLEALKPTLRAFVREARPSLEGPTLVLRFPENKAFHHKKAEEQKAALLPLARTHFGVEELAFVLEKKTPGPSPAPASPPGLEAPKANPKPLPPDPTPPQEAPPWEPLWEEPGVGLAEEDPEEDPGQRLAQIARLLGARLLWVRRPRAQEAEEPVSEDEIGGTGI